MDVKSSDTTTGIPTATVKQRKVEKNANLEANGHAAVASKNVSNQHLNNAKQRQSRLLSRDDTLPDRPCHAAQDSLFSSSSGYTNYRGFFNLCLILLTLSNLRVALENVIKYGILIDPVQFTSVFATAPYKSPTVWLSCILNVYIVASLHVEKRMALGKLSDRHGLIFYVVNLASVLIVPAGVVLLIDANPFAACFCLGFHSIVFMKLISYAHVNYWCRLAYRSNGGHVPAPDANGQAVAARDNISSIQNGSTVPAIPPPAYPNHPVKYPDNLSLANIYYFMFAPTLCYELNFPRSLRRRKFFILKRLVEFVFLIQAVLALCQQWIVPLLKNSLEPFIAMNYSRMLERLLKLAVPNHLIWLVFFYWLFHACLNLTAELLRFADRQFYRDWWNAETVQYFWQNWNIPVHKWCVRHLYKPMMVSGFSKFQASCAVFAVSAFFHEYLLSVPLHMFRIWAFTGMLSQIPLHMLTAYLVKGRWGNITVWLSLILGQPLCILMYVHDWYVYTYLQQSGLDGNALNNITQSAV